MKAFQILQEAAAESARLNLTSLYISMECFVMSTEDHIRTGRGAEAAADAHAKRGDHEEAARLARIAAEEYGAAGDPQKKAELDARGDYYNGWRYIMALQPSLALQFAERSKRQFDTLQIDLWSKKSEGLRHHANALGWILLDKFAEAEQAYREATAVSRNIESFYPSEARQVEEDLLSLGVMINQVEALEAEKRCELTRAINCLGDAIMKCSQLKKLATTEDERLYLDALKGHFEARQFIVNSEAAIEGWDVEGAKSALDQALKKISNVETESIGKMTSDYAGLPAVQLVKDGVGAAKPYSTAMRFVCEAQEAMMRGRTSDVVNALRMAQGEFEKARKAIEAGAAPTLKDRMLMVNRMIEVVHERLRVYPHKVGPEAPALFGRPEHEVDLGRVIGFGKKPYQTFLSKNIGDFLLGLVALAVLAGLSQTVVFYAKNIVFFKWSVFWILVGFSMYVLSYFRAGRFKEIQQMKKLEFYGTIGAVIVFLAAVLQFLF